MKKVANIVLIILVIIAIILTVIISKEYSKRKKDDEKLQEVAQNIEDSVQETKTNTEEETEEIPYIEYEGYQVIGTIEIPKIDLKYPILIESTEEALDKSITRVGDGIVNGIGNLSLAGHNYINGSMFGDINKLEEEDEIIITDLHGEKVTYKVFDKFVTDPNNTDVLSSVEDDKREITLITCINGNKNRLIIKATENI